MKQSSMKPQQQKQRKISGGTGLQTKANFQGTRSNQNQNNNGKYLIESVASVVDLNTQDDEGEINSFQIYDALTKQITEKQIMPKSPALNSASRIVNRNQSYQEEGLPKLVHKSNSSNNSPSQPEGDSQSHQFEEDNQVSQDDFFDKRTGKKRSLTDEYHKFQNNSQQKQTQDRLSQGRFVNAGLSTNDTNSQKRKSQREDENQYQIKSVDAGSNYEPQRSDKTYNSSEDYTEKKDPSQQPLENKEMIGFFVVPVFQDDQFNEDNQRKLEFNRNISVGNQKDFQDQSEQEFSNFSGVDASNFKKRSMDNKTSAMQQQSYYQMLVNKSINFRYKMADTKGHFSSLTKFFTDFQRVTFDQKDFPIVLLDQIYTLNFYDESMGKMSNNDKKKRIQLELKKLKEDFEQKFFSIICCTYRKGFKPLLTGDIKLMALVEHQLQNQEKAKSIRATTDSNWGCTIRVGQMMLCQALMRHMIGYDHNLWRVVKDHNIAKKYKQILRMIQDNEDSHLGAFSIQNVAKMGFCHSKLPGEWYGPHAITIMLKDLNKLYQPSQNFQVCIFHDGNIYYDKIRRLASVDGKLNQLKKNKQTSESDEKREVQSNVEFVFHKYLSQIGYFQEFKMTRTNLRTSDPFIKETSNLEEQKTASPSRTSSNQQIKSNWKNGILVIIPTRLGLNKVNKEYFSPILSVFQCPLNVGIIGGRPSQALYFVGAQKQDLILLDPHFVQDALQYEEELRYGHLSYHTEQIKKINISKIDTSLAFGFYLKDYLDYERYVAFLEEGKLIYKDNWLFSTFEHKPKPFSQDHLVQNFYLPTAQASFNNIEPMANLTKKSQSSAYFVAQVESPKQLKDLSRTPSRHVKTQSQGTNGFPQSSKHLLSPQNPQQLKNQRSRIQENQQNNSKQSSSAVKTGYKMKASTFHQDDHDESKEKIKTHESQIQSNEGDDQGDESDEFELL